MRCDAKGNLTNFALNDKCAAGSGVFLETVADMLLADMGGLALRGSRRVVLTSTCAVFAESEIVAEIHRGSSRADILWGVHESLVSKIAAMSWSSPGAWPRTSAWSRRFESSSRWTSPCAAKASRGSVQGRRTVDLDEPGLADAWGARPGEALVEAAGADEERNAFGETRGAAGTAEDGARAAPHHAQR